MIVHIGYHKTGSTFLQNSIFPHLEGIEYHTFQECKKLFRELTVTGKTDVEKLRNHLRHKEDQLYSYEGLVGLIGSGQFAQNNAQVLKELGFQKIILSIRRQDRLLESVYRQYIQVGGKMGPKDFLKSELFYHKDYFNFWWIYKMYAKLFGEYNILIINQESLFKDQSAVIKELEQFTESKLNPTASATGGKNESLSNPSLALMRMVNRLVFPSRETSNPLNRGLKVRWLRLLSQNFLDPYFFRFFSEQKDVIEESARLKLLEEQRESNRKLDDKCQGDLKSFGYY